MNYHVITIFPNIIESVLSETILSRAKQEGHINLFVYNPREYTEDKHQKTDDKPFGGGPGMVMKAEPILKAWKVAIENVSDEVKTKTVIFSPQGKLWKQNDSVKYSKKYTDVIMICGRYEGVDKRVEEITNAEQISIGNYILSGGELPACVLIDSISRHIKGVLGNEESKEEGRINSNKYYTKPRNLNWEGKDYDVPEILISGHHAEIEKWKSEDVV